VKVGTGALVLLLVALGAGRSARADAPDASRCTDAYVSGQHLMRSTHLLDARAVLLVCAREPCPAALRPECAQWLSEVQGALPSVVIGARSATGDDLRDVRVSVDGQPLLDHLDGVARDIDPGDHAVRLESPGFAPIEQHVLVQEGQKARVLVFRLEPLVSTRAPIPAAPTTSEGPTSPPRNWPAYVLGGIGVLATASFAYFGLTGLSIHDQCHPGCNSSQVADGNRDWIGADISLGVALASFGAAAYFLLRPGSPQVSVAPMRDGWAAVVQGRFE
jgi:hypothetical protein